MDLTKIKEHFDTNVEVLEKDLTNISIDADNLEEDARTVKRMVDYKQDILNEFKSRLSNSDIDSEIDTSIEQVKRIALLRLEELISG